MIVFWILRQMLSKEIPQNYEKNQSDIIRSTVQNNSMIKTKDKKLTLIFVKVEESGESFKPYLTNALNDKSVMKIAAD